MTTKNINTAPDGQADKFIGLDGFGRIVAADADDAMASLGMDVAVNGILGNLSTMGAVIGQLSRQVNGGRISLVGGTLDDPAITIGNVAIYSAAADTLSIAVANVEVLRITPSGLMTKDEILEESL